MKVYETTYRHQLLRINFSNGLDLFSFSNSTTKLKESQMAIFLYLLDLLSLNKF